MVVTCSLSLGVLSVGDSVMGDVLHLQNSSGLFVGQVTDSLDTTISQTPDTFSNYKWILLRPFRLEFCPIHTCLLWQSLLDSVSHKRLLGKLASFGVQGKLLKWIENFLTDRQQKVVLNGHQSRTSPVISGVQQGSVLGPLLFIMFINDLPTVVTSSVLTFADDAKIFQVIRTEEDHKALQNDLNALHAWSTTWKLKFNILKCKLFHLGPHHSYGWYFLNGTEIERITQHKGLL